MTNTIKNLIPFLSLSLSLSAACGPTFDPASLIANTRVVGARIEVDGAPDRASPRPGETATISWLVTSPEAIPPLGWTFAVCAPGTGNSAAACLAAPLARFDGSAVPPRFSVVIPSEVEVGEASSLTIRGGICAGADTTPAFDGQTGLATCAGGVRAITVSLELPLQRGDDANHNPVADRAFTFDRAPWPATADDPCAQGPRVSAASKDHVIGNTTDGSDREPYMALLGDPPALTATRERLQIAQFTTAGKLKSQYAFVEASDARATAIADVTWDAPDADEVPAGGVGVTFTFVVRDERGGTDWTTRTLCVTP
jgi:hypothetical protein